jgi:hypothetical protein
MMRQKRGRTCISSSPIHGIVGEMFTGARIGPLARVDHSQPHFPTVLYCTVLYCTVLSCPVLSCPVLSCPVLSCTVLSCPVLSCTYVENSGHYLSSMQLLDVKSVS